MNIPFRTIAAAAAFAVTLSPAFANDPARSSNYPSSAGSATQAPSGSQNGEPVQYRSGTMMPSASWNELSNKRVEEVKGMDVLNQTGTKVGHVEKVLLNPRDSRVYAVISVGGFLGIGDTDITMPLDQMGLQGNRLVAPTTASKQELKQRGELGEIAYHKLDAKQIIGQAGGAAIGEAAGPAGMQGSQTVSSFDQLDANKDGLISKTEAGGEPDLQKSWGSADANQDGMIDRSEFSAFEIGGTLPPG